MKFENRVLFATQNDCRKTNTYIVKPVFFFDGLSYKTYVLVATSVPIVQPPGWSHPGGHLKGAQYPEGEKEGPVTQRPTEQGGLRQAEEQGSANSAASLYPGNKGSFSLPGSTVIKLTAGIMGYLL